MFFFFYYYYFDFWNGLNFLGGPKAVSHGTGFFDLNMQKIRWSPDFYKKIRLGGQATILTATGFM